MEAIKNPGFFITEKPGGLIHKQIIDYDGAVLLDETVSPHEDLIVFLHRPIKEYRKKLAELEQQHPLFNESLDVADADLLDFVNQCFDLAYSLSAGYPEAYFLLRIALEDSLLEKDDGSAGSLLQTGRLMLDIVSQLYHAKNQIRNIMEVCFASNDDMSQQERWEHLINTYPRLESYVFPTYWDTQDGVWTQHYKIVSLPELYFFELCAVLRSDKRIARCQHCWRYFVPKTKKKTDYCDHVWRDSRTCKQIGPNLKRKDGPAKDKYLLAAKILHARFYERESKRYDGPIPYGGYYDWSEEAFHARNAYLDGEISGEEFLQRINPNGERLDLDRPQVSPEVPFPVMPWKQRVEGNINFDPRRTYETIQFLDAEKGDPKWELITREDLIRKAKGDEISLREKYGDLKKK